ncbi:DUF488 family protein [Micromonospora sp. NPDC047548]|uniref:DUF488 domain-containing protein n=1 Tax=Micromonospora sp. NPDC047548 TaxID=3155624 RepID=UPI0033CED7ED
MELLAGAGVALVVDVRRYPSSRTNPDVRREALERWLPEREVDYRWEPRLGGRRHARAGEPAPDIWTVAAFRAYAAYTRTADFEARPGRRVTMPRSAGRPARCAWCGESRSAHRTSRPTRGPAAGAPFPRANSSRALDGLVDEVYAYSFIATNLDVSTPAKAVAVEAWHRMRTDIEDRIRDAKYGAALRHLPSGTRAANTVWMWGALLAVNLSTWLQELAGLDGGDGRGRAHLTTRPHRPEHPWRPVNPAPPGIPAFPPTEIPHCPSAIGDLSRSCLRYPQIRVRRPPRRPGRGRPRCRVVAARSA